VRKCYVYILASHSGTLYVGVTNDIVKRMFYHHSAVTGFVAKYQVHKLVYFETHPNPRSAIAREKQIKGWVRRKKIDLIEAENPGWIDLAAGWLDEVAEQSSDPPQDDQTTHQPPDELHEPQDDQTNDQPPNEPPEQSC